MPQTSSTTRVTRRCSARRLSPRRRPLLETLEDRSLLSGSPPTVLISGPAQVPESPYGPYTLNLTVVDPEGDPVTQWNINWGDGSPVQTLLGNPSSATHDYTNGPAVHTITASAVVGGETFEAHLSAANALLGTFVQPGGGQSLLGDMVFGRDDTGDGVADLYVCGVDSDDVAVYNGQTGTYVRTLITAAHGLNWPWSVSFGPDGNLYVSGQSSGNVYRYDFTTSTVSPVLPIDSVGGPIGLAFGPDDNLYVSIGTQVKRFDWQTGQSLGVFIEQAQGRAWEMEFRPDGYLHYLSEYVGMVRYDATTGAFHDLFAPLVGGDTWTGGFAYGPDGDLYVASYYQRRIAHYDGVTGALVGWISAGLSGPGALDIVFGNDANGDGQPEMYVSNEGTRNVLHYAGPFTATAATSLQVTVLDSATKFHVVDDAASDLTYKYAAAGFGVGSSGLNAGNAAPRGAASNAAGDKVWVVDASKKVFVYNAAGALLGSWTLGGLTGSAQVEDITTNGTDIWVVDAKQDKVFRYANAAGRTSGSQNPASSFSLNSGNKDPKGIVTDGSSLWVVNNSTTDKVFKYSLSGALLGSWTIDAANATPTGITLDPSAPSHLWVVDAYTDRVYQFDNAVTRTSGSQAASISFALAVGNTNPQGIADPPPATQKQLPFKEVLTVVGASPTGVVLYEGYATHLGRVSAVLYPDNSFVKTASDGSAAYGFVTPATATTGIVTITGGTRRFAGVTGLSSYVISTNPDTGVTTVNITGTLSGLGGGKADPRATPFKVNGGGDAPQGVPVFPGGTAKHDATGIATHLGKYTGDEGLFELLSIDFATLSGTFRGSFVFVAANGDRLTFNYGADPDNPGVFWLTPAADGRFVATFVATFTPDPARSTGRFAQVVGGSFVMVATSEPFELVINEGYTPPFAYTWEGEGSLVFARGGNGGASAAVDQVFSQAGDAGLAALLAALDDKRRR